MKRKPLLAPLVKRYVDEVGTIVVLKECAIEVTILDVRSSYGNIHFLVGPVHGTGTTWVGAKMVLFNGDPFNG